MSAFAFLVALNEHLMFTPDMKTLATGASGFIGSAIVRRLLGDGRDVRVLVRRGSAMDNIDGLPVEITTGDLLDSASLARAVRGCTALIHSAADYRIWVPDADHMHRVNVEGTRDLMLAALEAGVRRIVHSSSVATLATASARPNDETRPASPEDLIDLYELSKFRAEAEVRRLVRECGLPAVIVTHGVGGWAHHAHVLGRWIHLSH